MLVGRVREKKRSKMKRERARVWGGGGRKFLIRSRPRSYGARL